jgi:hypothetical protein
MKKIGFVLAICPVLLLLFTVVACNTTTPISVPETVQISQIIQEPTKFEGHLAIISGQYMGWQTENGYGPPVTRSDWVIKDGTGWIYVTGKYPGLDPVADIGRPIEVQGKVKVTETGVPYIEANSIDVKNNS